MDLADRAENLEKIGRNSIEPEGCLKRRWCSCCSLNIPLPAGYSQPIGASRHGAVLGAWEGAASSLGWGLRASWSASCLTDVA